MSHVAPPRSSPPANCRLPALNRRSLIPARFKGRFCQLDSAQAIKEKSLPLKSFTSVCRPYAPTSSSLPYPASLKEKKKKKEKKSCIVPPPPTVLCALKTCLRCLPFYWRKCHEPNKLTLRQLSLFVRLSLPLPLSLPVCPFVSSYFSLLLSSSSHPRLSLSLSLSLSLCVRACVRVCVCVCGVKPVFCRRISV